MSNKLSLEKDDDLCVGYEPSDSENDYSEEEKELLKEARKGKPKKLERKEEILAFDSNSETYSDNDDNDMADSDIEGADDDLDIPDAKAWGKHRRSYYNTDFIDQDYNTYNQREEEEALQEEEEAKAIQSRLAKQLDEADFFLDVQEVEKSETDSTFNVADINFDPSNLSKREKLKIFHKDSPEYAGLVSDFISYLNESKELLCPVLEYACSQQAKLPLIDFVETRNNIILSYCTNIAFYIYLKSKRISIKNHPITKRLAQSRKLLLQLEDRYENIVKPQLEKLLERIALGDDVKLETEVTAKHTLDMLNPFRKDSEKKEIMSDGEQLDAEEMTGDDDDDDNDDDEENESMEEKTQESIDERRGITYQIAKNKGLTPHRKKENRNPRVKHRSKFRKALIRRKGAVRTIRKESKRYIGEISGIKSTVIKGIKFKT